MAIEPTEAEVEAAAEAVGFIWRTAVDIARAALRAAAQVRERPRYEMIELVAMAMWEARRVHIRKLGEPALDLEEWGDGSFPRKNGIMEEARAAIEVMRDVPAICYDDYDLGTVWRLATSTEVWNAWIDAALRPTADVRG